MGSVQTLELAVDKEYETPVVGEMPLPKSLDVFMELDHEKTLTEDQVNRLELVLSKVAEIAEGARDLAMGYVKDGCKVDHSNPYLVDRNDPTLTTVSDHIQYIQHYCARGDLRKDYIEDVHRYYQMCRFADTLYTSMHVLDEAVSEQFSTYVDNAMYGAVSQTFIFQTTNGLKLLAEMMRDHGGVYEEVVHRTVETIEQCKAKHVDYCTWLDLDVHFLEDTHQIFLQCIEVYKAHILTHDDEDDVITTPGEVV